MTYTGLCYNKQRDYPRALNDSPTGKEKNRRMRGAWYNINNALTGWL